MNIGICDDDLKQIEYISTLIKNWSKDVNIKTYQSAEEMLFENNEYFGFDVVFLDIHMNEINGMELAKRIRQQDKNIIIVFITGVPDYVFAGYEVGAFRYLLKPIKEEIFIELLESIYENVTTIKKTYIFNYNGQTFKLDYNDIYYIEAIGHYITIYTDNGNYEIKKSISKIFNELNNDCFVDTHRSYIVNLKFVEKINRSDCLLSNGISIPISRSKYQMLNQRFIAFYRGDAQ